MPGFGMKLVAPPTWVDRLDLKLTDTSAAEYVAIQNQRDQLLRVVQFEIENYLNTPGLYGEGVSFPDRSRMTGTYYIRSESYTAHNEPRWIHIRIMCHCLEYPKAGMPREDDYLGLEVWLKCLPGQWGSFEVFRNTDSSSI